MGGTASTRRVTFEADENENITVVKGIRVSLVGGRRASTFDWDPSAPRFPRPAPLRVSLSRPRACPTRSPGLWEVARSFQTRDIHSEIVPGCVPSARRCAGRVGRAWLNRTLQGLTA